ncbi:MAG TPA: hypothetical protein P5555_01310 [Candidatus Paceibacterota bacterium]|nr:hypothetical protein [Candidatus Hydrogenedentota bacterium]HOX00923.1 hypothetical protein [Verrucomicrobiota bacterium]HRZ43811.1 hypothetical protein [Candidatus Paceibacterota bacterium]
MNLSLSDPAFLARAVAAAAPPADTLLAEMKWTGYSVNSNVPNSTSVDGFITFADYNYAQRCVASPYGAAGKACRFPTSAEAGGSNNSRYAVQLRVPQATRGSKARIKFKVYVKTPSNGGFYARSGDGSPHLFWWGTASVRTNDAASTVSALRVFTGSTQRAELAYTYAAETWYVHTYDVKMDASAGFIDLRVEKADGTAVGTLRWEGATGNESDTNGFLGSWGSDASIHGFTGSVASSSDTTCFPLLGPVMVYEPGA